MESINEEIGKEIADEAVTEVTEEIAEKTVSNGWEKKTAIFGAAMIAGGLVCRFMVDPAIDRIGTWWKNRKSRKNQSAENSGCSDENSCDMCDEENKTEN